MTAPLLELDTHDTISDRLGDAALASLLRSKPREETIPASVWWLIAETLRTSVTVRRTLATGGSPGERDDLPILITEAALLTEAALAELADGTAARPTPISMPSPGTGHQELRPTSTRPTFGLQLSVLFLARLLVSHRVTTPQRLANTLAAHLRALAALDPPH